MKKLKKIWEVQFTGKAKKQLKKLPKTMISVLQALRLDLEQGGPIVQDWPNYGQIKNKKGYFHCHLNKGHPRYVVVWRVNDNKIHVIEVRYVGTHEGINYSRIN